MSARPPVPALAGWLGYAGLLPFGAAALGTWLPATATLALSALRGWGAVILAFMGAVHWGLAIARAPELPGRQLALSVLPAVVGWIALLLPARAGLALLAAGFAALYAADRAAARGGAVPAWYPALRGPLTAGVLFSLGVGAAGGWGQA